MSKYQDIEFIDNPAMKGREENYCDICVCAPKILESWRSSLFSFEWVLPDGRIRSLKELPEKERPKRQSVEERISEALPIEKPVLGIGLMDNVEIGMGRAEFLTLAAHGITNIQVHIPKSNESDFKAFLADVQ